MKLRQVVRSLAAVINSALDRLWPPAPLALTEETFIVWEPCTHSHAEVVPGYVKYLLDLGFKVAVFATPARFDEGLFARFADARVTTYRWSQWAIRRQFRCHGMGAAAGVMITTARKISGAADYQAEQRLFARRQPHQALLLVDHDVQAAVDHGAWSEQIITLRAPNYRGVRATVVNPHYFGEVQRQKEKGAITRFITIGALRAKRRNTQLLLQAVNELHQTGQRNFVITVIGRGNLSGVPPELRAYFDIKGRVDFAELYRAVEGADFFLPLLDPTAPSHERYLTTGTSGSFQLIFGFARPPVLAQKFATANELNTGNAVVYVDNNSLVSAMQQAMSMSPAAYRQVQNNLIACAERVYQQSLQALRERLAK